MPIDAWARCCRPWPPPPLAAPPRGSDATREAGGDRHASHRRHRRHHPHSRLACCCDCRAARWHRPQPTGDWERERLSQRRWRLHWPAAVAQRPTWPHSQTTVCAGACVLFEWCTVDLRVCGDSGRKERRAMSTRHVDGGGCCCCLLSAPAHADPPLRLPPLCTTVRSAATLAHALDANVDAMQCALHCCTRFDWRQGRLRSVRAADDPPRWAKIHRADRAVEQLYRCFYDR